MSSRFAMLGGTVLAAVHFYRLYNRITHRKGGGADVADDGVAKLQTPPKALPDGPARQRERAAQARNRAMDAAREASSPETLPAVAWPGSLATGGMPPRTPKKPA